MTNLKQLDKNLEAFDKIIDNLNDFSEIAILLKKAQESVVTWTQELKIIKNDVIKHVWLIEKKYEEFIKGTHLTMVAWAQELKKTKDDMVKYVWLIDKKYKEFTKDTVSAMEANQEDINKKLSINKSEISATVRDQWIEIERWLKNAFNSKNFVLVILVIINLILNWITIVYLFLDK